MAYICKKPKGSCEGCWHHRWDEDENRMCCWAASDAKTQNLHRLAEDAFLGKVIEIIEMDGEPQYAGKFGRVEHVDSLCTLHGTWGGCGIILDKDKFKIVGE